jgi:GNAT superfamily N-acetyltransferase
MTPERHSIHRQDRLTRPQAEAIAALTRDAYARPEPVPGLPPPDGAFDSAESVLGAAESGTQIWTAVDHAGIAVGAARAEPHPSAWRVHRVVVAEHARGRGIAGALLHAIASAARQAGTDAIELNAVIERALPQYYARLGFVLRSRWAADDKPLTEAIMVRPAGAQGPSSDWPWAGDENLPSPGLLITWWRAGGWLHAVADPDAGDPLAAIAAHRGRIGPDALFAGADHWPGAPGGAAARIRARLEGGRFSTRLPPAAYAMPRTVDDRLWALWRFPSGIRIGDGPRPRRAAACPT